MFMPHFDPDPDPIFWSDPHPVFWSDQDPGFVFFFLTILNYFLKYKRWSYKGEFSKIESGSGYFDV